MRREAVRGELGVLHAVADSDAVLLMQSNSLTCDWKSSLKIYCFPGVHFSLIHMCVHVHVHVHVWQMYFRLSARFSLSISPSKVLTAVQRSLSMCSQTANTVKSSQTIPPDALFFGFSSFLSHSHLPFPLSFNDPFFFSLYLFSTNQVRLLASPTKRHPLFYLSPFVIIPAHSASHHHTLQCRIQSSPLLQHQQCITSILCNPLYVIFPKKPCLVASEVLTYAMSWGNTFCFVTSVFSYLLSSCKHVPVSSLRQWSGSQTLSQHPPLSDGWDERELLSIHFLRSFISSFFHTCITAHILLIDFAVNVPLSPLIPVKCSPSPNSPLAPSLLSLSCCGLFSSDVALVDSAL